LSESSPSQSGGSTSANSEVGRRSDLDALRAFAMLLGVVLHGALAYTTIPWVVRDPSQQPAFDVLVAAIHGFRMPLFFLVSGFFTAMLWQRRGLRQMLRHRWKRIGVPLLIGSLTILPLMYGAIFIAGVMSEDWVTSSEQQRGDSVRDLWTAAATNNVEAIETLLEGGSQIDLNDPIYGVNPLSWASATGAVQGVRTLLEAGASSLGRTRDGSTPLHFATLFGQQEVAKILLEWGGSPWVGNIRGETAEQALLADRATTESIAQLLGIPIDFDRVEVGRDQIKRRFIQIQQSEASTSGQTSTSDRGRADARAASEVDWISALQDFPFFHHLWFLWFLLWMVMGFALIAKGLPHVSISPRIVESRVFYLVLILITMVPVSFSRQSWREPGFGPDLSAGLIPIPHVLFEQGLFFAVGAVIFLTSGLGAQIGRRWQWSLLGGCVIFPFAVSFSTLSSWSMEWIPNREFHRWLGSFFEASYAWLMTIGFLGAFSHFACWDKRGIRDLSDASYWIYLTHLPLLIVLEALLIPFPLAAGWKLLMVTIGVSGGLFLIYRFWLAKTWIGLLLNGRRRS